MEVGLQIVFASYGWSDVLRRLQVEHPSRHTSLTATPLGVAAAPPT